MVAKYSTGGGSSGEDDSCTICGSEERLTTGTVEGVEVTVCKECSSKHSEQTNTTSSNPEQTVDRPSTGQQERGDGQVGYTISRTDSSWVDDVSYDTEQTPYLVTSYSDVLRTAIDEAGVTVEEVCSEAPVTREDVEAVLNGNAAQNDVGEKTIRILEEVFDVQLVDE